MPTVRLFQSIGIKKNKQKYKIAAYSIKYHSRQDYIMYILPISVPFLVSHDYLQDPSDAVPHAKQHTALILCTITNIIETCIICERKIVTLNLLDTSKEVCK